MFKIRGGIAVILATIVGIVLLIVALNAAQEAFKINTVVKEDLFIISGKARFSERSEERIWRPKKYVYVAIEEYPASFIIGKQLATLNTVAMEKAIDTATARIAIPKSALGLLQTRSEIKLYELSSTNGTTLFSIADALERDRSNRFRLYLQAALCFLGGIVLLIVPKRYLLKQ